MKIMHNNLNICTEVFKRQLNEDNNKSFQRNQHVTSEFIKRLGLEFELEGHQGCVNCLSWNENGRLLVSGSDDVQIIIWDALRHKMLTSLRSGHRGNIFSVKFMPHTNDNVVISGAADCEIRVHDITTKDPIHVISCHQNRVKRLVVTPDQPHVFWSAAEDGTVMQFDTRDSASFKSERPQCLLIDLNNHIGHYTEVKCLAINPSFSEMLAVGANDPYVRLFDRRMLRCRSVNAERSSTNYGEDDVSLSCVEYYVAGHLPDKENEFRKRRRTLASTYVAFSPNGRELLVNLGGEQIYLFNVFDKRRRQEIDCLFKMSSSRDAHDIDKEDEDGFMKEKIPPTFLKTTNGFSNHNQPHYQLQQQQPQQQQQQQQQPQQQQPQQQQQYNHQHHHLMKNLNFISSQSSSSQSSSSSPSSSVDKDPSVDSSSESNASTTKYLEDMKQLAKECFNKKNYNQAVHIYNEAIHSYPDVSLLYCNRAMALSKRNWNGDVYASMRDCCTTIRLDDSNLKAHFRLVKCLVELKRLDEAVKCLSMTMEKFPNSLNTFASLGKEIESAAKDKKLLDNTSYSHSSLPEKLSEVEKILRDKAYDFEQRFCGHCNTTTDIKEANYFGSDGQYIVAGSDDGSFFIWDRKTSNIVRILKGDESIVNCLEPHPTSCLLATSGIESMVRLWSPRPVDGYKNEREIDDSDDVAQANQQRMNKDPLELMLFNMGYTLSPSDFENRSEAGGDQDTPVMCRTS